MACHNHANFLKKSIKSILNQTFVDFEFIIIDDGSTDNSLDIINDFSKNDSRIFIIQQENIGLTKSLNKGISLSNGEYIARIDADDFSYKDRLKLQYNFLKDSDYAMVGGQRIIKDYINNKTWSDNLPLSAKDIREKSLQKNPFFHSMVMINKNILKQVGYYNESYFTGQDLELWSRALKHKIKITNISDPLIYFRIKKSVTISRRATWPSIVNQIKARYNYNTLSIRLNILKIASIVFRLLPYKIQKWSYSNIR